MKKTYMAPKAEIVELALEGMVATSSVKIDESEYIGNQQLSDHKEGFWGGDAWSEE